MKITDAIGNTLILTQPSKRIVSLFPSQTHLLWKLGLDEEVVGITRFCKYPPQWKKEKRIVGGTKDIKIERVAALYPDLILANKEENTKEIVEQLQNVATVYVSDVKNWEDNLNYVKAIGKLTGKETEAHHWTKKMQQSRDTYRQQYGNRRRTALYFIWRNPWMTAGKNTFIDTMLLEAGFENLTPASKGRYPTWEEEELKALNPEIVLLCDEPFPFHPAKHHEEIKTLFPTSRILFVHGEPFTWFGVYPAEAFTYFSKLQKTLNHAY